MQQIKTELIKTANEMKSETLKQLHSERRNAIAAQWFYLHISVDYAKRLQDNQELCKYVWKRYETAKENVNVAHRKVMNYLKGI